MKIASTLLLSSIALASAATIEDFQFNDVSGTSFNAVQNDAGTIDLGGAAANVVTNGTGQLVYSAGADTGDNVFRTSTLSSTNVTSGVYELSFFYSNVTLSGGDATGANVGFGFRDESTNNDLFLLRVHKQNGTLRLQTRIFDGTDTNNNNLTNFGVDSLSDLAVRAVFDLDADTMDVFWTLGAGTEQSSTGITIFDGEMDAVRSFANTNTNDFGAADSVSVDSLTLTAIPEPSSTALIGLAGLGLLTRRRK